MTEMAKGSVTHQRLIALLSQEGANFRVVTHEAVGKCEAVSEIRGTALGQGAKALVCKVKGNGVNQHVLAILAADPRCRSTGRSEPTRQPYRRITRFVGQPGGSR